MNLILNVTGQRLIYITSCVNVLKVSKYGFALSTVRRHFVTPCPSTWSVSVALLQNCFYIKILFYCKHDWRRPPLSSRILTAKIQMWSNGWGNVQGVHSHWRQPYLIFVAIQFLIVLIIEFCFDSSNTNRLQSANTKKDDNNTRV